MDQPHPEPLLRPLTCPPQCPKGDGEAIVSDHKEGRASAPPVHDELRGVDGAEPLGIVDRAIAARHDRDGIRWPTGLGQVGDGEGTADGLRTLAGKRRCDEKIVPRIAAERAVDAAGDRVTRRGCVAARAIEEHIGEVSAALELPGNESAQMPIVQRCRIGWA